jgi:hypothetical protein
MSSALLVGRLKEFQFDGIVERRRNLAAVFEYHLTLLPQSGSFFQSSRRWVPGLSAGSVTIWSTRPIWTRTALVNLFSTIAILQSICQQADGLCSVEGVLRSRLHNQRALRRGGTNPCRLRLASFGRSTAFQSCPPVRKALDIHLERATKTLRIGCLREVGFDSFKIIIP